MTKDYSAERMIPAGATCFRDKQSSAVAYTYERAGKLFAKTYSGRRRKPDMHYRYRNNVDRSAAIARHFEAVRNREQRRKTETAKRPDNIEIGHIFKSSWGYDQTNIDFFQVTALVGKTMVELRPISSFTTEHTDYMQAKVMPNIDNFTGPAFRRRCTASNNNPWIKIDDVRGASLWNGRPAHETKYH